LTSFPIRSDGKNGKSFNGVGLNDFSRGKIDLSIAELKEERAL